MPAAFGSAQEIVILCEGDTEELALRHFLSRQWQASGLDSIGLRRVNLRGRLQDIGVKARLFLDENDVLAVFTLIDLYGMDRVKHSSTDEFHDKVMRARKWLGDQVTHSRSADFFPHLSVHETEAWILAEGLALAKRLSDPGIQPDPSAERKNFQTPPHERINKLFLQRKQDRYQKILDGRPLFADMEFQPVYNSCRYFKEFYDTLKAVATRRSR